MSATEPGQFADTEADVGGIMRERLVAPDALGIAVEAYGQWLCWARNCPIPESLEVRFVVDPDWIGGVRFYDEAFDG